MKKHILRIIVTVLILAVIGGSTWFFFFKPGDDSVIYNDLVALSKTLNNKKDSIEKLKIANSISENVKDSEKEKYYLNKIIDGNNIPIFEEVTLIRGLIFDGNIVEFNRKNEANTKNIYESLYAAQNNMSGDKNNIIQTDNNNIYTYEMFLNKLSELKDYSINYLFDTLDSAYNYYVLLSKTATGVNKSAQDEIKNAINKYNSALNSCIVSVEDIIAYQKLIKLEDATIGSAKVYTITRMYGDLKNNFMTMFSNYVNLIEKVKSYDVKYVFNNTFVHDIRTASYESTLYAINNMAIRPSETTTSGTVGSILNIDGNWYNAFYDACVAVNTFKSYTNYSSMSQANYTKTIKKIYPKKYDVSESDYETLITGKYKFLVKNFSSLEKQFVISFNNIYKNANHLITETKLDGAGLFVKDNETKTKIAIANLDGTDTILANIVNEFRSDVKTIISFLGYKEFVVVVPVVEGE